MPIKCCSSLIFLFEIALKYFFVGKHLYFQQLNQQLYFPLRNTNCLKWKGLPGVINYFPAGTSCRSTWLERVASLKSWLFDFSHVWKHQMGIVFLFCWWLCFLIIVSKHICFWAIASLDWTLINDRNKRVHPYFTWFHNIIYDNKYGVIVFRLCSFHRFILQRKMNRNNLKLFHLLAEPSGFVEHK